MGNAALRDLAVIEPVDFDDLAGSVVAVDAHNWLFKYLTIAVRYTNEAAYTTDEGDEVANLIGIVRGLPKFLEHDLTPVFVFDGPPTPLKADEIDARQADRKRDEARLAEAREEGDAIAIAKYESRVQRLTDTIHETTRELLQLLDIPVVEAPAEGEAQAAAMARHDPAITHAGSDDYDTLLFGAPFTLRGLTSAGDPEVMDFERTLETLEITWEQLVDVGILAGTDFNDGLDGVGPKTALREIREHGDLWAVLDHRGATIPNADRVRALFLDPNVTHEYSLDTAITPDVAAARAYVTEQWGIPQDVVERGLDRIERATVQTGLDRFA